MNFPERVVICEVGPRDGFQNEKHPVSTEDKIECINMASRAGYPVIEIGSFVHPKVVPQMADTDLIAKSIERFSGVEYRALATNVKGVERAIDAGMQKIKLTVSASESHNLSNFNRTPSETVKGFYQCVELAGKNNIEVSGAISTAFGCPFEGEIPLSRIEELVASFIDIGVFEISLSDTTGVANPRKVYYSCAALKDKFPRVKWILHFHNTRGMALANVVAGLNAGITWFDSAFAGIGGCPFAPGASGNLSSEDLVHMMSEMGINTGVDIDKAIELGRHVGRLINRSTDSYVLKAGKVKDLIKEKPKGQARY
jgi:hydroxymethylglutaryl-CoA lyase